MKRTAARIRAKECRLEKPRFWNGKRNKQNQNQNEEKMKELHVNMLKLKSSLNNVNYRGSKK
jgi:hypothetical protein